MNVGIFFDNFFEINQNLLFHPQNTASKNFDFASILSFSAEKVREENYEQELNQRFKQQLENERKQKLATNKNENESSQQKMQNPSNFELLVKKYEPKTYTHLISNETMNREILEWLMNFGNKQNSNQDFGFTFGHENSLQSKICLISGPPGIGKVSFLPFICTKAQFLIIIWKKIFRRQVHFFFLICRKLNPFSKTKCSSCSCPGVSCWVHTN